MTDVEQLAAEAVGDVDHRGGAYAGLFQSCDDVAPGLGLELALEDVFASGEVGFEGHIGVAAALACLLQIHRLLALQQLQAHVGGAQIARDADEIGLFGAVAVNDIFFPCGAYGGDADGQTRHAGGCVAAHDVHAVFLAGQTHAFIECVDVFHLKTFADGQRHRQLSRRGVHGVEVAEIHGDGLVAQVLERGVDEVEVDALHQHVGGDERHLAFCRRDDGAVVAHAFQRGGLCRGDGFGETAYQAELTQFGDLHQERSIISRMMAATRGCASLAAFCTSSCVTFITCP